MNVSKNNILMETPSIIISFQVQSYPRFREEFKESQAKI